MKLVAISRILDEADIIEAFIRHTAAFAEHHIVLDNGSTDGTVDILRSLKEEGLSLSVYQNTSISFSEQAFMTFMFKEAARTHGADWVACLDGDEFIDDRHLKDGLMSYLEYADPSITCIRLPWVHYNYTRADDASELITPKRMINRTPVQNECKVFVRGSLVSRDITIDNGGHGIILDSRKVEDAPLVEGLRLAHYGERSAYQTIVKFTRGWIKAKAAGTKVTSNHISTHYKGPFEYLRDRPADLLHSEWFMKYKNESPDLIYDPIDYRGGDLRYTRTIDSAMLAVRSLTGYLEALGDRHGLLIDTFPDVENFVEQKNSQHVQII